ncbi:hypothetical protein [Acidithiobacillus sp.]|uniref:hypothetical protein n=1 Tax=Acidithiobacillus sp. TaxID=1872118 RepID=UPI0025C5C2CD|nr:hypothetical protein [Acidithiobacillus sp.]
MSPYVVISMDHQAWQAGYAAGLQGRPNIIPPELDGLAFSSGYIEGTAHRQGFDAVGREKLAKLLEESNSEKSC